MKREQIARGDFPPAGDGYDRASVDAHLAAVAAWTAALEAQISALEVERDALRAHAEQAVTTEVTSEPLPLPDHEPESVTTEADLETAAPVTSEPADVKPLESEADPTPPGGDDEVSARLVATRLALEGSDRDEITARIVGEYEIEDPAGLVEDVLSRLS